jgi:two-component system chemotaxis response regulator CheB
VRDAEEAGVMLIDAQMPDWEQRLTRAEPVDAAVEQTYRAIREVDLRTSPLLSASRGNHPVPDEFLRWPDGAPGQPRHETFGFERLPAKGFKIVADDGSTGLVLGFIGRWWQADYGPVAWSPEDLATFDRPGYGVGAWSLTVLGYGERASVLVTEVRLRCTDAAARHALGAHFALTSPLIAAMGQPMLRLIRQTAERSTARSEALVTSTAEPLGSGRVPRPSYQIMTEPEPRPPVAEQVERFAIVAIASSAGGIRALSQVLGALPAGFPVPVVVVQHLDPRHQTVIADILGRRSALRVKLAEANEHAVPGTIYVAPPNRHLLVGADGELTLSSSELVHFVRPSADLLFESVAGAYGARAIACVLTGSGSDGAMGVTAVKSRGGTVIAVDPQSAEFKGMPEAAVGTGSVDYVLPLDGIADVIGSLVESRTV